MNAITTDLFWSGQQSYMQALKASFVYTNNVTPRPPNGYTWADRDDVTPSYGSGEVGQTISRDQWREEYDGSTFLRDLSFSMWPKNFDRNGNIADAKDWARLYGWSLFETSATDNADGEIKWQDVMMAFDDKPSLVLTQTSLDLFECDYYEQDYFALNGVKATFKAENVLFGAFLSLGYDVGELGRYNPCDYKYPGAKCEAINGVVTCDGTKLTSGDLEPGDGTSPPTDSSTDSPTASPTKSPTTEGSITIDWQADRSYMFGRNVETILEGQTDYCFTGQTNVVIDSGSGNGPLMDRKWNEDCFNKKRRIYFKSEQYPNSNGGGFRLNEGKINNENGNAQLHWSKKYNSFEESFIILPDDPDYDAWTCEHVEFNFSNEAGDKLPGDFIADDFIIAMYLDKNYNVGDLKLFNPCHHVDPCKDKEGKCKCSAIDGQITCDEYTITSNDLTKGAFEAVKSGSVGGFYSKFQLGLVTVALAIGTFALI